MHVRYKSWCKVQLESCKNTNNTWKIRNKLLEETEAVKCVFMCKEIVTIRFVFLQNQHWDNMGMLTLLTANDVRVLHAFHFSSNHLFPFQFYSFRLAAGYFDHWLSEYSSDVSEYQLCLFLLSNGIQSIQWEFSLTTKSDKICCFEQFVCVSLIKEKTSTRTHTHTPPTFFPLSSVGNTMDVACGPVAYCTDMVIINHMKDTQRRTHLAISDHTEVRRPRSTGSRA